MHTRLCRYNNLKPELSYCRDCRNYKDRCYSAIVNYSGMASDAVDAVRSANPTGFKTICRILMDQILLK